MIDPLDLVFRRLALLEVQVQGIVSFMKKEMTEEEMRSLMNELDAHTQSLAAAVAGQHSTGGFAMAGTTVRDALIAQIHASESVLDSAKTWINGETTRLQAAIDKVTAGGLSAADLAPIQAEIDAMKAKTDEVSAAIVANTPAAAAGLFNRGGGSGGIGSGVLINALVTFAKNHPEIVTTIETEIISIIKGGGGTAKPTVPTSGT